MSYGIRTFRTGDMGMIAARQAILYAENYGWEAPMEVLLGEVTTNFLKGFKPGRERCWIAEREGAMIGSVFVTDEGEGKARLRLLYVEPSARGLGVGHALVDRCIGFAREAGYRSLGLWTHANLLAARRIYAAAGFEMVSSEVHHVFGKPELGETWLLAFDDPHRSGSSLG